MQPNEMEEVRAATYQGVREALSDPEVHKAFIEGLTAAAGKKARDEAGGWLWSWLRGLGGKVIWFLVITFVLAKVGGLPAVLAWWKAP